MQIIHEISGLFRITLVRDYLAGPNSKRVITRTTPFCLLYRSPDDDKAQNQELNDALFKLFLTLDPANARIVNQHLVEKFRMSDGMLEELLKSPKTLIEYVQLDAALKTTDSK